MGWLFDDEDEDDGGEGSSLFLADEAELIDGDISLSGDAWEFSELEDTDEEEIEEEETSNEEEDAWDEGPDSGGLLNLRVVNPLKGRLDGGVL